MSKKYLELSTDYGRIRVTNINGEAWYWVKDIAHILGVKRKQVVETCDPNDLDRIVFKDGFKNEFKVWVISDFGIRDLAEKCDFGEDLLKYMIDHIFPVMDRYAKGIIDLEDWIKYPDIAISLLLDYKNGTRKLKGGVEV